MADVKIPFGEKASDTAVLLLAAAETLDRPVTDVRTVQGAFLVDEEIANEAGFGEKKKAAKKTAAKKTAPRKKAAKKTAAKKSATKESS